MLFRAEWIQPPARVAMADLDPDRRTLTLAPQGLTLEPDLRTLTLAPQGLTLDPDLRTLTLAPQP